MKDTHSPVPLSEFFAAVERRLARELPGEWPSFQVEVAGKIIELRFSSVADAEFAALGLRKSIIQTQKTPHSIFKYWKDKCAEYVGAENLCCRWSKRENAGYISNHIKSGFVCADYQQKIFYCCEDKASKNSMLFMHALHMLFYQWALEEKMFMLHAAAVGAHGKGILIAGRSGAGKSTLSVSCLLSKLDFVGDDYIILTGDGIPLAMPIYSSVCLNPDMYQTLKPDMRILEVSNDGKLALDASAYPIVNSVVVGGLIVPMWNGNNDLSICPIPSGAVITRIVHSTLLQAGIYRDTEQVRSITGRLSGLPAFEFHQCRDPRRNAEFLREFIIHNI